MRRRFRCKGCGWVMAFLVLVAGCTIATADQHQTQIAYWRQRYQELRPEDDARAAVAQAIFQRLVQVAGKRAGVVPRLFIIASDPWETALPMAIRDGWIILSKGVLDICYRDPARGDDRLAFVLGHELAHQLKDDLWHLRFFQAFDASHTQSSVAPAFLEELQQSAYATAHVLARELQADEHGIIYAAMAGFTPQAIVAPHHDVNFFAEWVRALDPRRMQGVAVENLRPSPQERAEALRAALRRVAAQTSLFHVGLWSYYAGDYPQAIRAFDHFRSVFPSREVHHNLAASHHQLALQAYQVGHPQATPLPLQLSLAVAPLTRASQIYFEQTRGEAGDPAGQFHAHLDMAIRWYREALAQDAAYIPAAQNLGAALILRGVHTQQTEFHPDFAEAVAILSRALKQSPQAAEILNNLGVALWYEERPMQAQDALTRAHTFAPASATPLFNLAALAAAEQREADASRYRQAYARLTTSVTPAVQATSSPAETLAGVTVGSLEEDVPAHWGVPTRSTVRLEETPFTVATYPAGVMTLARDGEVLMLMARTGYPGSSARGIALGSQARDVLRRYGPPSRRHELPRGRIWSYDTQRITFQLRDGRVVSWLRF